VLGRVATARIVHVDVPEFYCAPLELHFLLGQHSLDISRGIVTDLNLQFVHLQLVLCTESERFVADCCPFVRFSSVSGRSKASPLNMLLGYAQYR
jgi:hypothetical protein